MRLQKIMQATRSVIDLMDSYPAKGFHEAERTLEPLLFGYFAARFQRMTREHRAPPMIKKPGGRVDLRHGGTNPVVIELAVRPRAGGPQLYGPSNKAELAKLTRIPPTQARSRILLLVDLGARPITRARLERSYFGVRLGAGRFPRHLVRVIYVHQDAEHSFPWRP
jgi:hypothetical protein